MGERIAMGFHTCVDYELLWDTQVVEEQIRAFDIHAEELQMDMEMDSERSVWIACLAHLKEGIGGEMVPDTAKICEQFASHFTYDVIGRDADSCSDYLRPSGVRYRTPDQLLQRTRRAINACTCPCTSRRGGRARSDLSSCRDTMPRRRADSRE